MNLVANGYGYLFWSLFRTNYDKHSSGFLDMPLPNKMVIVVKLQDFVYGIVSDELISIQEKLLDGRVR